MNFRARTQDGWQTTEGCGAHECNFIIARYLDGTWRTVTEIEEEIRRSCGGNLPRGGIPPHLDRLANDRRRGGYLEKDNLRPIRYRLTEKGKCEWNRYLRSRVERISG